MKKAVWGYITGTVALALIPATGFSAVQVKSTGTHVPGQVIVKLKEASGHQVQANLISALQAKLGDESILDIKPFVTDKRLHTIQLAKDGDISVALSVLKDENAIAYAEPNFIYRALDDGLPVGAPNDPDFAKTWGIFNFGQKDPAGQVGTAGSDVGIMQLWQNGIRGSRKVLVAVIDTGIDWTHPDLIENLYTNPGEAGELATNGKDDDGNGFIDDTHGWNFAKNTRNSSDDHDHGTHVAGTIGAVGNNGVGVAGVNWEVSLLPVKFLDAQGGGTAQGAIESINYATKMKVQVMNNSWGGGSFSQTLMDSIVRSKEAGILFAAAAGNDGTNNDTSPTYPASYKVDNILAVAATDNTDKLASFSNYGRKTVHVAAPGVKVYSTTKSGKYAAFSGTSMATPHAVGVAALLSSANPQWTFSDIKDRMITTSDPVRGLSKKVFSRGRINAYNAMNGIVPPSDEPDESKWQNVEHVLESDHPYADKANLSFEIKHPGAKYIRVHFEKIQTERNFDVVKLETTGGELLEKLSGDMNDYTTDYAAGDTVVVKFTSDVSVNGWGFKVDRIQVITE